MVILAVTGVGGLSLFAFGYYIGKQIGRTEHIRHALSQARESGEYPPREWEQPGQASA